MKRLKLLFEAAALAPVVGLIFSVSAAQDPRPENQPVRAAAGQHETPTPATVAPVERGLVSHPIHAAGQIRAKTQVDLAFLVGGEVTWVGADVGSRIRRGQILARLDQTVVAADADRAHVAASQSQRDLDRALRLQADGAVPAVTLEAAKTGSAIAAAQARSADFALRHSTLVAPDDGVVDARFVERGQTVGPGQPAFR